MEQYLHYFCGDANDPQALSDTEPLRISFYKAVAAFLRALCRHCAESERGRLFRCRGRGAAGEMKLFYGDIRSAIKKHSGEELDIKPYEADMRHLINTYIQADPAAPLGNLSDALAHRTDHRDRHPRCHRPQTEREGQALAAMPSPKASSTTSARRSSATS